MESAILRPGLPIRQENAGRGVTSLGKQLRLVNDHFIISQASGQSGFLVDTSFDPLVGH